MGSNTLDKRIIDSIPSSSCLHLRSTSSLKVSSPCVLEVDIGGLLLARLPKLTHSEYVFSTNLTPLDQPRATVLYTTANVSTR